MTKGIDNIKGKNGFHVWSKNWEKPLQVNAFKSLKCSNVLGMTFADVEYWWYLYVQSITLSCTCMYNLLLCRECYVNDDFSANRDFDGCKFGRTADEI